MDIRGMGPPQQQAAAAVPSLLQMAQGEAPQAAQNYAPQWVMDEWNRTPASAPMDGGIGGGGVGGYTQDQLAPWYNPANWGPPPEIDAQGRPSNAATGGFWSGGDALKQQAAKYGGQMPEVLDQRPNTSNWHLLGGQAAPSANNPNGSEPGNYMTMGHLISQLRRQYDLKLGTDPSGYEGGGNWSALRFGADRALGPEFPAMRPHGSASAYGIPGQLEPWWVTQNGPL